MVPKCQGEESKLVAVDGREIICEGERNVELTVQGTQLGIKAIVLRRLIDGIDVVLGMDVISQMGGVVIAMGEDQRRLGR